MRKRPKPDSRVTVAWECPACGTQHLWDWKLEETDISWRIFMHCDTCDAETGAFLTRIGRNAWAAAW